MGVWVKKSHVGKVATWQKTCNADDLERSRDMGDYANGYVGIVVVMFLICLRAL